MYKICISILMVISLFLTAPLSLMAAQNCIDLLEKNCTGCHYNTRICNKIGKKNKRKWKSSVKRMLRYGLKIDKKAQSSIVDCLVSLEKKEDSKFCKDK